MNISASGHHAAADFIEILRLGQNVRKNNGNGRFSAFVIANDAARSQMDRYKSGNSAIYQAFGMSMTRRQLNKLINFK